MDLAEPFSSSNLHTVTPVRRRESTVNNRLFNAGQEQEWTAARCHRLLRALTSRVAILKKDILWFQSTGKETVGNGRADVPQDPRVADAEWTKTKKRIRQTYSGRGGRSGSGSEATKRGSGGAVPKKGRISLLPGEVTIPTPILARARGDNPPPPPAPWPINDEPQVEILRGHKRPRTRHTANDGDDRFQPSETLRDLRQKIPAARYTTYEGIYNGLEALLRATIKNGSEEKTKSKGPRSLLSMALHAVPRYITQQEGLLEAHMEATGSKTALNQRDISTEIYDELESFGSSRHGWKRLKVIVRSHGIQVLRDAIYLGLLDDGFCSVLIALCINTFATEEAQSLLSALLSSRQYPSPKTLYDTPSRPLSMLSNFTKFTSRASFQFRELSSILSNGLLPFEWLATKEFASVWTKAMQRLSPGAIDDDAVAFLDNALSLLASVGTGSSIAANHAVAEAVKNTFSSLLTTLSSIVILSNEAQQKDDIETLDQSTAYGHIIAILEGCLVQGGNSDMQILLLLSNLIVHDDDVNPTDPDYSLMDLLLARLRHSSANSGVSLAYTQAVSFICQVARCCGRGSSSPGLEHLKQIHLLMVAAASEKEGNSLVQGLIVDSAFSFAQKVPDRQYIDYAASVEARFSARRLDVETSLPEAINEDYDGDMSGFRWEEGIGEWVTATPAAVVKTKVIAAKAFADDSECDTPYRPPPKLRRLGSQPAPIVHVSSSPFSSPNFDDSVRVHSLNVSPSGSGRDIIDISSEEEEPTDDRTAPTDGDEGLGSDISQEKAESESEDDFSKMEVSFLDDSIVSHGLTTSLASMGSCGRPLIDRAPRLSRKLLRNSQDWQVFEDSFVSTASSGVSNDGSESTGHREFVDRAPRLGRRALRSSQAWQLFEDSDDELSILSGSSHSDQALKDVTSTGKSNSRRPRQVKPAMPWKTRSLKAAPLSDSEDELCI